MCFCAGSGRALAQRGVIRARSYLLRAAGALASQALAVHVQLHGLGRLHGASVVEAGHGLVHVGLARRLGAG